MVLTVKLYHDSNGNSDNAFCTQSTIRPIPCCRTMWCLGSVGDWPGSQEHMHMTLGHRAPFRVRPLIMAFNSYSVWPCIYQYFKLQSWKALSTPHLHNSKKGTWLLGLRLCGEKIFSNSSRENFELVGFK